LQPLAIHHVSIAVSDLEEALEFYEEALGFTVRSDRPELSVRGAWLETGSGQLHLIHTPPVTGAGQHFAVLVEDLDASVAELRRKGLTVSDPVPVGRSRQSFLSDPSGNLVELHEAG
jgi:glyoxylase I family protein